MSQNLNLDAQAPQDKPAGWWRTPMMWLVVGGPALVIVASFVTLSLAISHPDPVLEEKVVANKASGAKALLPAREARNHAATGGQ
ncbi:hypothetical protein [Paucibacter sp. DJ2R-2]|uniref:hypothetical protein n=1 Tax=Paucibacter sp. DJ2R-2 TaxID=2893558 RepID=UPI0021E47A7D|nr:hypothetical protein [Paucibacter sp. DJ2R-2]MCV2422167.1 hypothetical protein [Paucibacter sp. DJ4R-1]MCV2440249.1 hypothetical protein [Paucibacter sp. DJ2R-2]